MYKLELSFDIETLGMDVAEKFCTKVDEIFQREQLKCDYKQPGQRIYADCGRKQDYGKFWSAIFTLRNSYQLKNHLKECFWYNGKNKENLITEFMRN